MRLKAVTGEFVVDVECIFSFLVMVFGMHQAVSVSGVLRWATKGVIGSKESTTYMEC